MPQIPALNAVAALQSTSQLQVSLALTDPALLARLLELGRQPSLNLCLKRLGWSETPLADLVTEGLEHGAGSELLIERVHLGNEFCERLLPTPVQLQTAQQHARTLGVEISLLTPLLTDSGSKRLRLLLDRLPPGAEVVVNDWGTLRLIRTEYPALEPLLGRLLYKMIKDPRLPSAQWTKLHPHSGRSKPFQRLLARFGVDHIEMDVPPFTQDEQFLVGDLGLSVHLPYGYVVKGRMCRIGSLGEHDSGKFIAAHACRKECLDYVCRLERPQPTGAQQCAQELVGFQRGNTQFYRYSGPMQAKLVEAVKQGLIKRLVFAGDWNEHCCPHQSA